MNTFDLLQTIFTGVTAVLTIVALVIAFQIGNRQNEINQTALNINNFVEIFLMPQSVVNKEGDIVAWKILLQNVSSYPIYLNSYILNGVKEDVGSTAIPTNADRWYSIVIPKDVELKGKFSITVNFEDYLSKKYQSDGFGKLENGGWNIHQNKRIEIIEK